MGNSRSKEIGIATLVGIFVTGGGMLMLGDIAKGLAFFLVSEGLIAASVFCLFSKKLGDYFLPLLLVGLGLHLLSVILTATSRNRAV